MSEKNYLLMRTPSQYIEENQIVYGWSKVDFSKINDVSDVLSNIKIEYGTYGRRGNQIKRFFRLKKNDVVIVPMKRSLAIGIVDGHKSFVKGHERGNRISVNFKCENGKIRKLSTRGNIITNSLLSRLRVRQTNVSLNHFSDEIEKLINSDIACSEKSHISDLLVTELLNTEITFKGKLLNNIKLGNNVRIKGGGDGFELLVCELLEIEGYKTKILSKNSNIGKGDIDIEAVRTEFYGQETRLVIQAKHHKGISSIKSLRQVTTAINNEEVDITAVPMVISTGSFDKSTEDEASENKPKVILMNGDKFIDWLFDNISELSEETQLKLGVSQVPMLLES